MTRSIADWLYRYRWWPWVITALLLPFLVWPSWYWFEVRSVYFSDSRVGEPVPMVLDRSINRAFYGRFTVSIWRWDGGWVSYCTASGEQPYRVDAQLPKTPTLDWWTWGKCHPLPVGRYITEAVWFIDTPVRDKKVTAVSNIYEVHE